MSRAHQSTPSDHSSSDWESASEASDLSPSPSPTQQPSERIPRPPNCFILYRAHAWKARKEQFERDNVDDTMTMGAYGRHIGPIWRNEPPEVKEYWEKLAADAKREHEAKYPDYQYRPNRGGTNRKTQSVREERTTPAKRAPCRPESKAVEGKEATLSQAERTMKTRSMTRQRQVVGVRTGVRERKANAASRRRTTTMAEPHGNRRPTRTTTRGAVIDLTANFDVEDVEGPTQNPSAPLRRSPVTQQAIQPLPTVGGLASPPIVDLLPRGEDILSPSFAFPVEGMITPVEQVLPAHSQFRDVFSDSFVPSEPQAEWMHPEHDRPSLWDSPGLPLFPPEIFEGESGSASHNAVGGVPDNWSQGRFCTQPTFSAGFGAGPSQPMVQVDPLFVGWPTSGCGGQYLGQHLGSFPEPQAWTAYA